eukprot:1158484-Pelagomonas_calceolata.AAC.15
MEHQMITARHTQPLNSQLVGCLIQKQRMVRTSSAGNAAAAEREKQQGGDEGSSLKRGRGKAGNAAAVHSAGVTAGQASELSCAAQHPQGVPGRVDFRGPASVGSTQAGVRVHWKLEDQARNDTHMNLLQLLPLAAMLKLVASLESEALISCPCIDPVIRFCPAGPAQHTGIPKAPEAAGGSPDADNAAAVPQKKPRLVEGTEGEHCSPVKAGKAKGKGAPKQQSIATDDVKEEAAPEADQKQEVPVAGGTEGSSRRRAAARGNKAYKDEGPAVRTSKHDMVVIKEEAKCPNEAAALEETGGSAGGAKRRWALVRDQEILHKRALAALFIYTSWLLGSAGRLLDFAIVDDKGNAQPLERALLLPEPTFLTGIICPALEAGAPQKGANASKERERGRRVEKDQFGPLKEWRVAYTKSGPQVRRWWGAASFVGDMSWKSPFFALASVVHRGASSIAGA